MQRLWCIQLSWDELVSEEVAVEWRNYSAQLTTLNKFSIPRYILCENKIVKLQLHGFADSSIRAYGACVYIRSTDENGHHTVRLLQAKSKVAPIKTISLPRLELCAALLLARMVNGIVPKLKCKFERQFYWTDSSVTLAWISSPSAKWKTFVAHRVGEIQDKTSINDWCHVRSEDNPADLISRGCTPNELRINAMWWNGPHWLKEEYEKWPKSCVQYSSTNNIPEAKNTDETTITTVACVAYDKCYSLLSRRSSLLFIIRVTAYCLRWRYNMNRAVCDKNNGPLTVNELDRANTKIVKIIQRAHFRQELRELNSANANVSKKSKLLRLSPYIDGDNIIRVGGRLKYAMALNDNQRHQIVLPDNCLYTKLLFRKNTWI
ncbi:uncharacterized protein LOC126909511 [Daktulosphaira vitifoliae]|uniref:uncharacterized protein LOC126909511 n=1 Tax=Daktulosphaira vitifoliae TaxID=58002 RepID=UPI0021AA4CBB|nr:uncharacterized protein LOC126909511 [Daktulosphaira vitifoliae]